MQKSRQARTTTLLSNISGKWTHSNFVETTGLTHVYVIMVMFLRPATIMYFTTTNNDVTFLHHL